MKGREREGEREREREEREREREWVRERERVREWVREWERDFSKHCSPTWETIYVYTSDSSHYSTPYLICLWIWLSVCSCSLSDWALSSNSLVSILMMVTWQSCDYNNSHPLIHLSLGSSVQRLHVSLELSGNPLSSNNRDHMTSHMIYIVAKNHIIIIH